jgi:hypothetical protein
VASSRKTVDEYIKRVSGPQKEAACRLRELIKEAVPEAEESIKWAQPVYELNGPFAFMRAGKFHVTLGFWRGTELKDPKHLLQGEGKRMRHLKVPSVDKIPEAAVKRFAKEAALRNKDLGDPTKGKGA